MQETCMCWGFSCGDGWFNLIDQLCGAITNHIQNQRRNTVTSQEFNAKLATGWNPPWWKEGDDPVEPRKLEKEIPEVIADQVKEKFGTLRFYYHGGDEYIRGLVSFAEDMSGTICETCGNTGTLNNKGGWYSTKCMEHGEGKVLSDDYTTTKDFLLRASERAKSEKLDLLQVDVLVPDIGVVSMDITTANSDTFEIEVSVPSYSIVSDVADSKWKAKLVRNTNISWWEAIEKLS